VVENPANATATAAANKIPIANATGYLNLGWTLIPPVDSLAATPYVVPATAKTVFGAATAGADQIVTLPAAAAALVGHTIRIYKQDANAHNVIPTPAGADTIDGVPGAGASSTITVQYGFVDLECVAAGVWQSAARRLA
jgi:plastocyanin